VLLADAVGATVCRRAAQRAAAVPVETASHAITPVTAKMWRAPTPQNPFINDH